MTPHYWWKAALIWNKAKVKEASAKARLQLNIKTNVLTTELSDFNVENEEIFKKSMASFSRLDSSVSWVLGCRAQGLEFDTPLGFPWEEIAFVALDKLHNPRAPMEKGMINYFWIHDTWKIRRRLRLGEADTKELEIILKCKDMSLKTDAIIIHAMVLEENL